MILEEFRTSLKPAASTALFGGLVGTVVMAVGFGLGLTVGGILGFLVSTVVAVVSTGIYLYTFEQILREFGVDARRHRRQARRAYRQFKQLVSIGVRKARLGLGVALRSISRTARMVYTRLRGGIR